MFGKMFKSFACFLVGLSFTGKLWGFFIYSEYVSLIGYIIWKYFLTFYGLFNFPDGVL